MGGACVFTWTNGSEGMRETVLRLEEGWFLNLIGPRQPMRSRWLTKKGGWRRQEGGAPSLSFLRPSVPSVSAAPMERRGLTRSQQGTPTRWLLFGSHAFPSYVLRSTSPSNSPSLFSFFLYKHLIDSLSLYLPVLLLLFFISVYSLYLSIYLSSKKRERERKIIIILEDVWQTWFGGLFFFFSFFLSIVFLLLKPSLPLPDWVRGCLTCAFKSRATVAAVIIEWNVWMECGAMPWARMMGKRWRLSIRTGAEPLLFSLNNRRGIHQTPIGANTQPETSTHTHPSLMPFNVSRQGS